MTDRCPFCLIIAGQVPAAVIHRDERVIAFLDTRPIRPGHTLVVPLHHEASVFSLEPTAYTAVFSVVRTVAQALQRVMRPRTVGLVVAGWDVPHAHVHLIPMAEYHDITSQALLNGTLRQASAAELDAQALLLRRDLGV